MPSTELQDLSIDEMSGVDAPANQMPGWMVMKAEGTEAEAQLATLYGALGGASALADAPEDVQKAAELLAGHIEKELTDDEDEPESLIAKMGRLFKRHERVLDDLEKGKGKPFGGKQAPPFKKKGDDGDDGEGDDDGDDENDVQKAGDETRRTGRTAPADGDDDLSSDSEPDVIEKALGPLFQHVEDSVEKALEPVADDMETFRAVVEKMLERIEVLEDCLVGSAQPYGQDAVPVTKSATFQDAIIAAAQGNRVTLS